MTESDYSTGYSKAPGSLGIKAPDRLASRYLTKDVGYTMEAGKNQPGDASVSGGAAARRSAAVR
jgi:hypothetical protein